MISFNCFIVLSSILIMPWRAVTQEISATNINIIPVKVGVVLDLETPMAKIWLSCINMSISDFYASHPHFNTRLLLLQPRDSKKDDIAAASAALDLIKNEQVQAILGPHTSSQAKFMIELGQKARVPILSFSATSPALTSTSSRSPYFFRAAINDSSQVNAISALVAAFGWREVVPIYADNDYGQDIIPYLVDALQSVDARVPYRSVILPSASDEQIVTELYKLMTMQTRVFVVHMWYNLGARLFEKAREIGMMKEGFVWIVTNDFTDLLGSLSPSVIDSMQGVLGVKTYVPNTRKLESFRARWKREFRRQNPEIPEAELNVMGLWAYDSAFALALAVEKVFVERDYNTRSFVFEKRNIDHDSNYSTIFDAFGVSQNGPRLCEALSMPITRFSGVAGDFRLVNGQLESSTFQIVNVNGGGGRSIGFWSPEKGLTRNLSENNNSSTTTTTTTTTTSNGWHQKLGPIIWPGESTAVPKGWEIPTSGKRLRIGVPVKKGFKEFVDVKFDEMTNTTQVTGFSIDVFEAAVRKLPYALPYDYFPFAHPDRSSAGTYEEMISQVYFETYDAVVADSTIRANRSLYVDFTLPYTESGVVMVVPMKDSKRRSAWVFLKPLTWDLWVTSLAFFIFIGFVVWVLEHQINEDFRGSPSHQMGTTFCFSFSTMVFAHSEKVVSNLARFVVIIWVFVVLILTQSYTASLTSLLTVEQLQPTVIDIHQLLKNGDKVGYLDSSHVYGLLKQKGFQDSNLLNYSSVEECDQLLSKGSANGGISAAFDDSPNMMLFLSKYCSNYTMIGTIFKTAGFGFVFPKGSPLVADISRAILNVTEVDEMKQLENKWLKSGRPDCRDLQPRVSSNYLSLDSFWGLFLIAGTASLSSLAIFAVKFLYKRRHVWLDSRDSVWRRIREIFKSFDQKDLSSRTFRKSTESRDHGSDSDPVIMMRDVVELQNSTCPPNHSVNTEPNSPFLGDQVGTIFGDQTRPEVEPTKIELVVLNQDEATTINDHPNS